MNKPNKTAADQSQPRTQIIHIFPQTVYDDKFKFVINKNNLRQIKCQLPFGKHSFYIDKFIIMHKYKLYTAHLQVFVDIY